MASEGETTLLLTNWRSSAVARYVIPARSLYILDSNGSGKTSLLSALYTLSTGQPFPGTRLRDALRYGSDYFGIQNEDTGDFVSGVIRPNGRLSIKKNEDFRVNIPVFTYIPTDNLWFGLSRTRQLEIWDTLIFHYHGAEYARLLLALEKNVTTKSRLIRAFHQEGIHDEALIQTTHSALVSVSERIWTIRQEFLTKIQQQLPLFASWIDSDTRHLSLHWTRTNALGIRTHDEPLTPDCALLWHREVQRGAVLYGAHRDDIGVETHTVPVSHQFSRGELRALVLFFKKITRDMTAGAALWMLDDIFNEFDSTREQTILSSLIHHDDRIIATGTKPLPAMQSLIITASLRELSKET
jgi:recombinational DNA repair ATPase RecF